MELLTDLISSVLNVSWSCINTALKTKIPISTLLRRAEIEKEHLCFKNIQKGRSLFLIIFYMFLMLSTVKWQNTHKKPHKKPEQTIVYMAG